MQNYKTTSCRPACRPGPMVKATPRIPSECGAETIILRPWLESWLAAIATVGFALKLLSFGHEQSFWVGAQWSFAFVQGNVAFIRFRHSVLKHSGSADMGFCKRCFNGWTSLQEKFAGQVFICDAIRLHYYPSALAGKLAGQLLARLSVRSNGIYIYIYIYI